MVASCIVNTEGHVSSLYDDICKVSEADFEVTQEKVTKAIIIHCLDDLDGTYNNR